MTKEQEQVKEWMLKAGQNCPEKPCVPSREERTLRLSLIAEELRELAKAFNCRIYMDASGVSIWPDGNEVDLIEAADATADLKVVVIGTEVAMGIDGELTFQEVHRSNMTKFIDGHRREDGKWIKGKSYSPANLKPIIEEQMK